MSKGLNNLEAKISLVQKQTHSYLQEIRGLIEQLPNLKNPNVISYFTSNLNISHNTEYESLCLGSYHIYNIGNEPLINPYICIKLPEASLFSFSGRYVHEQFQQSLKGPNEWLRFTNDADANKKEYWLKPLGKTKIEPNEIVSFSNFQIRWFSNKFDGGSITGFTYCDQFQDGISVVNPINLSIIKLEQEELL